MILRFLKHGLFVAACVYIGLLLLLYLQQRNLLFPRDPSRVPAATTGIRGIEEVTLTAADGERLVAWVVPPQPGKPVLLYFHGNGGNLGQPGRIERFRNLTADGTGLFALSYRGYGGSTGSPSEAGLHLDARALYGAAAERFGAAQLIAYGESLGTGVALKLAAEVPLAAVVLEAPYLSAASVAQRAYPYVPVRLLMLDPFRSDEIVGRLRLPLLVMHGTRDGVIRFAEGEALYGLANAPKRFLSFPQGNHGNLAAFGALDEVRQFLGEVAAGTLKGAESRTIE
ncbi:hypothetical protein ASE63_14590 [Bosea sp. Root381]|uniref:alpha/beta hydrolase n=1 Tax=Bosea sp. Root381 TaxID=1736524 RepID=UPI0006FC567B|nr:alpha/beta hydrolase [Bosea sp. Root381]KRE16934.1 hypothetical protein ASE63_14590 [Bosea sp. Root381]